MEYITVCNLTGWSNITQDAICIESPQNVDAASTQKLFIKLLTNIPVVRQRGVNTYAVELPLFAFISKLNKTTCVLDPFPTKLLMSHLSYILNIILCIVNLCFSSGVFPTPCKSSIIFPLIKKQGLEPKILKNYRPVANLSVISKNYLKRFFLHS